MRSSSPWPASPDIQFRLHAGKNLAAGRSEGREKIDAFIQCFGSRVYLQNLCSKTNKMAEENLGQFWGEKEDHSGADLKISSAFTKANRGP